MVATDTTDDGKTVTHYGRWHVSEGAGFDHEVRDIRETSALLDGPRGPFEAFSREHENAQQAEQYQLIPLPRNNGFMPCTFCNDPTHVRERGVIYSDYKMVDPATHDTLGYTCHACVDE